MYLVSHCYVKKNSCEICNIFLQQIYFFFYLVVIVFFFVYNKRKIYEDTYFSVFLRLNFAKCVIKKLQS